MAMPDATRPAQIGHEDLEPQDAYEARRHAALRDIQAHKAGRRMQLADDISLLWESRATVRHQVQEMVRMEGDDDEAVAAVFREYAPLVPSDTRWTATMFVEVRDPTRIRSRLRDYAGLENAVRLLVDERPVAPEVIGDHGTDEATTAVTYLAFPVGVVPPGALVTLVVDHPNCQVRQPVPDAVRQDPS